MALGKEPLPTARPRGCRQIWWPWPAVRPTTWQAFADSQGRRQMLHLCRGPDGVALGKGDGVGCRLAWAHFVEGLSLLRARPSAKRTFAKCEPLPTARHSAKDSLPTAGPGPR